MKKASIYILIIGIIQLFIAGLFKITHWPGANFLTIFGLIVVITAIIFMFINKKNE